MLNPGRTLTLTSATARAVASLAEDPEFHLSRVLEPGDLEIIHNPTIFHARSDIHDGKASPQMSDQSSLPDPPQIRRIGRDGACTISFLSRLQGAGTHQKRK